MQDQAFLNEYDVIFDEKQALKREIQKLRLIIQEYEENQKSSTDLRLKLEELKWYNEQNDTLQDLLKRLHVLRLEGGAFVVYPTNRLFSHVDLIKVRNGNARNPEVLVITNLGVLNFYDHSIFMLKNFSSYAKQNGALKRRKLLWLNNEAKVDVRRFEYIDRISVVKLINGSIDYERSSYEDVLENLEDEEFYKNKAFYNQYTCLKHPSPSAGLVKIQWVDSTVSYFIVPDPHEFIEVIGAHVRHFNQKKVWNVEALKSLYCLKRIDVAQQPEEEWCTSKGIDLLKRLWDAAFEGETYGNGLEDLVYNPKWTLIGFQNSRPFTDLRSTGLLGLWCLVYFAEKSLTRNSNGLVVQDLARGKEKRNYPWAASGINVTWLLLRKFLQVDDFKISRPSSDPNWNSPLLTFLSYLEPTFHDTDFRDNERPVTPTSTCSKLSINSPLRKVSSFNIFTTLCNSKNIESLLSKKADDSCLTGFEDVFCFTMELLDRIYLATNAGYMEYPIVIKEVEKKLIDYLNPFNSSMKPTSLNDLWQRLDYLN